MWLHNQKERKNMKKIILTNAQALKLEWSNEPLKIRRDGEIYYITRNDDDTFEVRNSGVVEKKCNRNKSI